MEHIVTEGDQSGLAAALELESLGDICVEKELFREAIQYLEEALENREKSPSDNDEEIPALCRKIGYLFLEIEKFRKGLGYFEHALKLHRKLHGDIHVNIADDYRGIGIANNGLTFYMPALNAFKHVVEIDRKTLQSNSQRLSEDLVLLGDTYSSTSLSRHEEALECFREAITIKRTGTTPDDEKLLLKYLAKAGRARLGTENARGALAYFEKIQSSKGYETSDDGTKRYVLNMIETCRSKIPGTPERAAYQSLWLAIFSFVFLSWPVPLITRYNFEMVDLVYWLLCIILGFTPSSIALVRAYRARKELELKTIATIAVVFGGLGAALSFFLTFSKLF